MQNLCVINNALTIKMFFATDRVVQAPTGDGSKRKNEKLEILWSKNYWV